MPRSSRKSIAGSADGRVAPSTTPAKTRASTAPVASLSADSAMAVCSIFWRIPIRSKSGMRIAGSVGATTPDEKPRRPRHVERERGDRAGDERRDQDPGIASRPRPIATRLRPRRELEPAVEEDEGHAERQKELGGGGVERDVDRVGDRRSEQRLPRGARACAGSAAVGDEVARRALRRA